MKKVKQLSENNVLDIRKIFGSVLVFQYIHACLSVSCALILQCLHISFGHFVLQYALNT